MSESRNVFLRQDTSQAHIAKFVCNLCDQIKPLFTQVLMTCDAQGLIVRDLFAIDRVKLPSNASKERSGTHVCNVFMASEPLAGRRIK